MTVVSNFRENLLTHFDKFRQILATDTGDWVVKGFIDTEDMARAIDSDVPYRTLEEYWEWRERLTQKG